MNPTRITNLRQARVLSAQHEADRAVLAARARRSGLVAPTPEEIESFAVGGCNNGCAPTVGTTPSNGRGGGLQPCNTPMQLCRPSSVNDCYHELARKYNCPLKMIAGGRQNVDGQQIISFQVEPTQSPYFAPVKVRLRGRDQTAVDTVRIWWLTAVQINGIPQETFNTPSPNATVTNYIESDGFRTVTCGDVPGFEIAWGVFSKNALGMALVLIGWQPSAAATFVNAGAELWGYELPALPSGWECGRHPTHGNPNAQPTT